MAIKTNITKKFSGLIGSLVFILLCNLLQHSVISAQDRRPDRGYQAGNTYSLSEIETVNTRNGNLMLNIPLASLPAGRGGSGGFTLSLHYDSKIWGGRQDVFDNTTPPSGNPAYCDQFPQDGYRYTTEYLEQSGEGGWYWGGYYDLVVTDRIDYEGQIQAPDTVNFFRNFYKWRVQVRYPDGSMHDFVPAIGRGSYNNDGYFNVDINGLERNGTSQVSSDSCGWRTSVSQNQLTNSGMNYYSTDGSFTRLFIPYQANGIPQGGIRPWMLYNPDGSIIEKNPVNAPGVNQRITDRNGNKITFDINGISDDLGRSIFSRPVTGANGERGTEIVQKGVSGEELLTQVFFRENYVYRRYKAIDGIQTVPLGTERDKDVFVDFSVVDRIVLPAQAGGQQYKFDYYGDRAQPSGTNYTTDGWGELKSIELPGGAKAEYEYQYPPDVLTTSSEVLYNGVTGKTLTYTEQYDGTTSSKTDNWSYSYGGLGGGSVGPDGSGSYEKLFGGSPGPRSNLSYRTQYSNRMVERIWAENQPTPNLRSGNVTTPLNPYVKTEFTTIYNAANQPWLTAIKDYNYDKNGNVTKITEYDWVPYNSVPRQTFINDPNIGYVTGLPSDIQNYLKRVTVNSYYNQTPDAATTNVTDQNVYVFDSSPLLKNVLKSTEIRNGSETPVSRSEFFYDDANNKGNLTETRTWDSNKNSATQAYSNPLTASNSVSSTVIYNDHGSPKLTTDAKGNQTQITYGAISAPNGTVSDLYPTQVISAYGTAIQQTVQSEYDFSTGLVKKTTALGNTAAENVSSETVYDALGRPLVSKAATGTPNEIWTQTAYDDTARTVTVKSDLYAKGDGKKVGVQHYDQLGRVFLSRTLEDSTTQSAANINDGIKVQTRYQAGNPYSYQWTSNPYRAATAGGAANEPSMGWTRRKSISTGRHSEVETFSGASLPAPWGTNTSSTGVVIEEEDANATTTTDEAGKKRRQIENALGNLVRVDEPNGNNELGTVDAPNQPTNYNYDARGNLIQIGQGGQSRTFVYDSLNRLKTATNPESGTFQYGYDNNGNLTTKTDARNVATTFSYDALNRVVLRDYSDATPDVTYTYDNPNIQFSKGELTKVSSSVSTTENTQFDQMGRTLAHKQTTDGSGYTTGYVYNLAGDVIEETYPSGRVVRNVLDNGGDLSMVQSRKSNTGFWTYASNFTYTASEQVSAMRLGNGRWESAQFNARRQATQIGLGNVAGATNLLKLDYGYNTPNVADNNGNVKSQTISVPGGGTNQGFVAIQNYEYDSLNRLKSASETIGGGQSWKQTFVYDRFGNRNFDTNNTTTLGSCQMAVCNPAVDISNNRFTTAQGYQYDLSGNVITDAEGKTFTYNAENKQKEVRDVSNNVVGQYFYDGDGRRVKKVSNTETVIFVYDAEGKLIAEYANQPPPNPQVSYLTTDALGSPRIKTDANGNVISRSDNLPFGEDLYTSQRTQGLGYQPDSIRRKFTTYKRDDETGLDFAEARYYSSRWGRFVSPDEFTGGPDELFDFEEDASNNPTFYSDLENPQSLNKYQYTYNNPLNLTDSDGHCPECEKPKLAVGPLLPAAVAALIWILSNPQPLGPRQPQTTGEAIGDILGMLPGGRGTGGVMGGILNKVLKGVSGVVAKQAEKQVVKQAVKQAVKQTSKKAVSKTQKQVKKEARGGRSRIKTGQDAQDQLEGIQKAQDNLRQGKGKGKTIIDSTKKSQQRVDNKNKKIKNLKDALDEYNNK